MREAAFEKGRRYLREGRLVIRRVDAQAVEASCKGDSGVVHAVEISHGRSMCSCPAKSLDCSHLVAVRLVTLEPRGES